MIFISGATGQLGTAVINALLERGTPAAQIVAGSRKPEAAAAFATRGIQVRTADYADPASLVAAYQGIEVLYLVSGDAPIEIRSAQHRNAIAAAVKAGVKRVSTSFVDTAEDSPFGFARIHADTERALAKSGLETTILRHGVYADILPAFVNGFAERGAIASPNAQGKAAFIARADLAAAAAVVLSAREHAGKTYTLTGPSALNMAGIAALLAARSGKPVAYQVMPAADYAAMLVQATGMPDWLAEALAGMFVAMDRGGYDNQSGDFARLLGRDALPVEAVLAEQLGL